MKEKELKVEEHKEQISLDLYNITKFNNLSKYAYEIGAEVLSMDENFKFSNYLATSLVSKQTY